MDFDLFYEWREANRKHALNALGHAVLANLISSLPPGVGIFG
jgi:hypothetical protein